MTPRVAAPGGAMRFEIGCDSAAASQLCAELAAALYQRYGVCEPLQGLELALSELLSNVVRHGRTASRIGVSLRCGRDRVRLSLLDDGPPFNMAAQPSRLPDDPLATSGRGLWLVQHMTAGFRGRRWRGFNVHGLRCALAPGLVPAPVPVPALR